MRLGLFACWAVTLVACTAEFPEPRAANPDAGGGSAGSAGSGGVAGAVGGAAGAAGGSAGATDIPGLVGYWPLDGSTGSVAEDAVGSHDGTFQTGTWITNGVLGGALDCEEGAGVTMASLSGASFPPVGTIALWFKADLTQAENRGIFDNYDAARSHIFIRHSNMDTPPYELQVGFQDNAGGFPFLSGHPVKNLTWQYVAVGWDIPNKSGFYYLEGNYTLVDFDKPSAEQWTPAQQEFNFGQNLIGNIDEIRLYDRVLTHAETTAVGQSGLNMERQRER